VAAIASSLIVGAIATAFMYIRVVPLILEAEAFEVDDEQVNASVLAEAEDQAEEWAPADGAERGAFTFISNVIISFAFALLLVGFYALDDVHVSVRSGLQRGVVGWTIFMGLPCAGLSPELPGMAAAELTDRQWWWFYAVLCGAAGFAVALLATRIPEPPVPARAESAMDIGKRTRARVRHALLQALLLAVGVAVAAVPHLTGAPHPHLGDGDVETSTTCGSLHVECERSGPPSEMAAAFAVWCLATAFAYWLCLGVVASAAYNLIMGFEAPLPNEVEIRQPPLDTSASHTQAVELAVD